MKIAFVHPAFIDYRSELFEKLNKRYDIRFIFTDQDRGQEGAKEDHLRIPHKWNHKIVRSDKLMISSRPFITYLKLMIELLRGKYDVLLTSTKWYACFCVAKIRRKKFILWTEYWHWTANNFIEKLLNSFTLFIAKHADAIIATGTKSYKAHLSVGIPSKKIFTYPQCAIDYSKTSTKDLREELGLENKKIVLYLGRIVQRKGLDYLIKAFALLEKEIDNVFLLIVGDGPFIKECKDLAKKLNIKNIHFMGYIDPIYKASCYKACDVFVLPAIFIGSDYEPWGLVINEAMAFGKSIVATDAVGAVDDLVKDGYNGYVVKNKNIQELYEALHKILLNSDLAKVMGENSRKIFEEKNDYGKMFEAFKETIDYVWQK